MGNIVQYWSSIGINKFQNSYVVPHKSLDASCSQMQQREAAQMAALAEEWKKRDKERELLVTRKVLR